jgi:hypothetical protein
MGGKTATTTQSVQIPPEVLARYNAVNARAEQVASQPFQQYTGQFVAPINATQQAGINNTMAAANMAQPYYQNATNYLTNAYGQAAPMMQGSVGQGQTGLNTATSMFGEAMQGGFAARDIGSQYANQAMGNYNTALGSANPYMGQAGDLTQAGLNAARPLMGQAGQYLEGGTQAVNAGDVGQAQINKYMSPYMRNVVESQQALQQQENAAQMAALKGSQIGSGAFGGDRSGISAANLAKQQSMANQATLGNLLQQGYGQALSTAQQQQGINLAAQQANRAAQQFGSQQAANLAQLGFGQNLAAGQQMANLGQAQYAQRMGLGQALAGLGQQQYGQQMGAAQMQAGLGQNIYGMNAQQAALQQQAAQGLYGMGAQTAQSMAGLGAGAQQAALQGAQAQIGAGTLEQQTQQAQNTAQYQQFLQERGYPFQVAQFLANIAMGTGALSGSTTTSTQQAPFFSDERLKNDIEPVGELYDGQKVYRYEMGDGRKQIGLIAQEVEGVRPDAVGEAQGFKTVDYDRATQDAAGLGAAASMGGAVTEPGAYAHGGLVPRHGYALSGAVVDGSDLGAILASQAKSFGPFGQSGLYGGSGMDTPFGATKGSVPSAGLPTPKLVTAGSAPMQQRRSGLSDAVSGIKGTVNTGKELASLALGSAGTKDNPKGEAGLFGAGGKFSSEDNLFKRGKDWLSDTFAYGGVVPREGYALKGMVDPYEPIKDMSKGIGSSIEDASESQDDPNSSLQKPGSMPGAPKSGISQVGEAASTAMTIAKLASMLPFSDARLKDNIEPVGETYDGQRIYRYDMGDGRTQIGLMAQEVLRKHPEAVGERNGFLTLDYDKATGEAVPFAYGGLVPRQGYATEGAVEEEVEKPSFDIERAKSAISGIESGGRYEALGPMTGRGDRAYGKYQVMGANIPSWTEEALGRRLNPEEFLKDRDAQEKVFEHHFGKSVQKYGNPYDAASVWFSGRPMGRAGNASDILGTTVPAYVSKFRASYEGDAPRPPGLIPEGDVPERRAASAETTKGSESKSTFDKLSEKATSRDFLVPALSFVGSMLSSKSPYLAGAIGEGIVGGVQGYQSNVKQQADLAKSVLDIVKDRFVIRSEGGKTVYFNKSSGQTLTPEQFNSAVSKIATGIGVSPAILGIDTTATAPGAPSAVGAIPAIGAGGQQPQAAPGVAPVAPGAEAPKPGEPPKPEDKKPVDIFRMSQGELAVYAEQNPEKFGLTGPRDPAKLRQEEEAYRIEMLNAQKQGNEQEAQRSMALMKDARDRREKYILEATDKQYKDNLEIQKASTQRGEEYRGQINTRLQNYSQSRGALTRLAQIYGEFQPSRAEAMKAELASWADQFGIKLPESFNTSSYDQALKIATSQAFSVVGDQNLSRSPKAALTEAVQTVPNPSLGAGAAYALIGRAIGEMDYINARDRDYIKRGRGTAPEDFISDYDKATGNTEKKFIGRAFEEIPIGKGVERRDLDSLSRTYNFGRYSAPADRDQETTATAIPPENQRESGKVYTVPGKGEYRWMGTGWQKVGQ